MIQIVTTAKLGIRDRIISSKGEKVHSVVQTVCYIELHTHIYSCMYTKMHIHKYAHSYALFITWFLYILARSSIVNSTYFITSHNNKAVRNKTTVLNFTNLKQRLASTFSFARYHKKLKNSTTPEAVMRREQLRAQVM